MCVSENVNKCNTFRKFNTLRVYETLESIRSVEYLLKTTVIVWLINYFNYTSVKNSRLAYVFPQSILRLKTSSQYFLLLKLNAICIYFQSSNTRTRPSVLTIPLPKSLVYYCVTIHTSSRLVLIIESKCNNEYAFRPSVQQCVWIRLRWNLCTSGGEWPECVSIFNSNPVTNFHFHSGT